MDTEDVAALAPSLKGLTRLQVLNLHDHRICSEGLSLLAPSLHHLTGLKDLDLCRHDEFEDVDDGEEGVAALARKWQPNSLFASGLLEDGQLPAALSLRGPRYEASLPQLYNSPQG